MRTIVAYRAAYVTSIYLTPVYSTLQADYLGSQIRNGREAGSERSTSLTVKICSFEILQPLAHNIACGETCQQWLTPAQTGLTK
jgi:hypothetical protein